MGIHNKYIEKNMVCASRANQHPSSLGYQVICQGRRSSSVSVKENKVAKVHSIKVEDTPVIKVEPINMRASMVTYRYVQPPARVNCVKARVQTRKLSVTIVQPTFSISKI